MSFWESRKPLVRSARRSCSNAWAELDLLRAKTLAEMSEYPVLLCPVASIPAFRPNERAVDDRRQSGRIS